MLCAKMEICLWLFPEADFADWCELVESPQVANYRGYLTLLAAIQADQERAGYTVIRVAMTVAEMRAGLKEHGLDNTPGARASIVALLRAQSEDQNGKTT
jgi:hypothetical protein